MAAQGGKVNWTDITSLYSALNTARSKFSFSQITPTNRQGQATQIEDISRINTFVSEMSSNKNLTSVAKPVTVPARGELMKPSFLTTLSSTITSIQNSNAFGDSSFGNSSFGNTSFSDSSWSFGNSSFSDSSWSFGDSSWSFGNSSWGNSSWGNSSWGNSSFGNTGFGFWGGGDGSYRGQSWG